MTDFEATYGIPAERVPLTGETNADRAVLARIGGRVYITLANRYGWDDDTTREATAAIKAQVNNRKASRRAQLPEAAFDWPIYLAAHGSGGTCRQCGEPTTDPLRAGLCPFCWHDDVQ